MRITTDSAKSNPVTLILLTTIMVSQLSKSPKFIRLSGKVIIPVSFGVQSIPFLNLMELGLALYDH